MRNSVISSLVTTIVAKANGRLVAAGVALRTLLHHTSMRDCQSNWREPHVALEQHYFCGPKGSQGLPGSRQMPSLCDSVKNAVVQLWQDLKRPEQRALALCPAYAAHCPAYAAHCRAHAAIARVASKG